MAGTKINARMKDLKIKQGEDGPYLTLALRQGKHVADGYLIHGHPKTPHPASEYVGKRAGELSCPKGADCPLIIPTLEEPAFFEALGLRWIEPQDRTAEWLWAQAKKKVVEVRA